MVSSSSIVIVFERLDALSPYFLYKAKAVLLLIARQLNVTVVSLLIDIVLVIAKM